MGRVKRAARSCAPIQLTSRDRALLDALTRRVKLLPLDLVERLWWPNVRSSREMMRRLALLESSGLLARGTVVGRVPAAPVRALTTWRPGELPPNFADVLRRAREEALGTARAVRVVTATQSASGLFGGAAPTVRPSEVSHDLRVAAVFAARVVQEPACTAAWICESVLESSWRRDGGPVPDAVLALPGRNVVVEVVGTSYSPASLAEMHCWCERKGMGYELW